MESASFPSDFQSVSIQCQLGGDFKMQQRRTSEMTHGALVEYD
ncbi:hypothetical protein EKH55_3594 [Sinorhizobium alkalisoli]|nr:hypothetical protein EKH55_3594 [Sinorhizobium alkalisoli]